MRAPLTRVGLTVLLSALSALLLASAPPGGSVASAEVVAGAPPSISTYGAPTRYVPVQPVRIYDTRPGQPPLDGDKLRIRAQQTASLVVPAVARRARAVVLTVTVVAPSEDTYISAGQPDTSDLQAERGSVTAGAVTATVSAPSGRFGLYNAHGSTDLVVDLLGYYVDVLPGPVVGNGFAPVRPTRVWDSRSTEPAAGPKGRLPAGGSVDVPVTGASAGVPADAAAVVLNVTGIAPGADTFLSVLPTPAGAGQPVTTSAVNIAAGRTAADLVVVPVGAGGRVRVVNGSGPVDAALDVSGYYSATAPGLFVPVSPLRVLDTRSGSPTRRLGPGAALELPLSGARGLPAAVTAVVATVTAVAPSADTYLTVSPADTQAPPSTSTVNVEASRLRANAAYLSPGTGGAVRVRNAFGEVDVLVDVAGYFVRLADARPGRTATTSVASVSSVGLASVGSLYAETAVSADGNVVAFVSSAANLVRGDTNDALDVFVRDRRRATTTRVSTTEQGRQIRGADLGIAVSADGSTVLFSAGGEVVGGPTATTGLYAVTLATGSVEQVNVSSTGARADGYSRHPSVSSDGRFVAFDSPASVLGGAGIYVRDRQAGTTRRVDVPGPDNKVSLEPAISADGRRVLHRQVFSQTEYPYDRLVLTDLATGRTEVVGLTDDDQPVGDPVFDAALSGDGRHVAFGSRTDPATGLVGELPQVLVRDLDTGRTRLATTSASGGRPDGASGDPGLSADGSVLAFSSNASDLGPVDTDGRRDLYVRDLTTGRTTLVGDDVEASSIGGAALSADGRLIAFVSSSTHLVPRVTNAGQVYVTALP